MTRPHIVRADSIDLQDPEAPSAKDHKNATNGQQPVGAHQAETLREVAAETKEERRISWANGDIGDLQQYAEEMERADMDGDDDTKAQQRDALAISLNGGSGASDDGDDMDTDGDGDLDDDMMDKISSSPSIEDGGCPQRCRLAGRHASILCEVAFRTPSRASGLSCIQRGQVVFTVPRVS
ncbi:Tip elongation aberrant protein Tea4 [Apiospora arundinis]